MSKEFDVSLNSLFIYPTVIIITQNDNTERLNILNFISYGKEIHSWQRCSGALWGGWFRVFSSCSCTSRSRRRPKRRANSWIHGTLDTTLEWKIFTATCDQHSFVTIRGDDKYFEKKKSWQLFLFLSLPKYYLPRNAS